MAPRGFIVLALAALLALSAPTAFSLWAPRASAVDGRAAALRGAPSQAPVAAPQGEASGSLGSASAFAAAALGLIVALAGAPALAEEAAAQVKKDNPVVTVLTKEERLKQQREKMQAELNKLNMLKADGTLKNGQ
eukprot:CAMPEP_0179035646 /NCGR_PEP_ID=MMETSP0796-20121207/13216_1 /TAXON_ID=73915 /ORGANISM="Pyrodinium bahamense, Strain pbaha01" /LENGTH=134 /DNA_ID=CAMNT_0020731921 /DNA_START=75 /DNA_END=479 /DNA_ORIENTATION=-